MRTAEWTCHYRFRLRLSHKSTERPGSKGRRQMSRSQGLWEGFESIQSPGNGCLRAAANICDSLAWRR
jgi:hypothetical protein